MGRATQALDAFHAANPAADSTRYTHLGARALADIRRLRRLHRTSLRTEHVDDTPADRATPRSSAEAA